MTTNFEFYDLGWAEDEAGVFSVKQVKAVAFHQKQNSQAINYFVGVTKKDTTHTHIGNGEHFTHRGTKQGQPEHWV